MKQNSLKKQSTVAGVISAQPSFKAKPNEGGGEDDDSPTKGVSTVAINNNISEQIENKGGDSKPSNVTSAAGIVSTPSTIVRQHIKSKSKS